jgi:hypothetical protein
MRLIQPLKLYKRSFLSRTQTHHPIFDKKAKPVDIQLHIETRPNAKPNNGKTQNKISTNNRRPNN